MSRPPRLRSLSPGSSALSHFTAPRAHANGRFLFSIPMHRFRPGLRHHGRTKSGSDLPTPTEDPRTKPAPLRRTNSMLGNPNPTNSFLDHPAPPTSSTQKRKVSNPMSFVTGILGRITPSEGSPSRFLTRSRLLPRRGLDTPPFVLTPELSLAAESTTKSEGRGSAREEIQDPRKRKKPLTSFDGLSQATTATNVPFTTSSFSYASPRSHEAPSTRNTPTSSLRFTSDLPTLRPPARSSTAPIIDWRSKETATGAGSSTPLYTTANVIASSSSPRSRVTSTSTIPTTDAHRSSLHSRKSSNKDLPALPALLSQREDDEVKPEPAPLTLEDIIALESPRSWRSLSPQEDAPSSVPQPVRTPTKKAALTDQPRFPSTFRQLALREDQLIRQESPLPNHSDSLHTQNLPVIGSSIPGSARVTPQQPLAAPLLRDPSECSTPTPAPERFSSVFGARRASGSSLSNGTLRPTLPLRLSSRQSSITLPTVSPVLFNDLSISIHLSIVSNLQCWI
jgi:hypothetical protein